MGVIDSYQVHSASTQSEVHQFGFKVIHMSRVLIDSTSDMQPDIRKPRKLQFMGKIDLAGVQEVNHEK